MRSFITALQFLTRIHVVKQDNLTAEDFGRSVKTFPFIGLVLGVIYALIAFLLLRTLGWSPLTTVFLTILPVILTGGIHADGFMDTMDGTLSSRDREKMLAIMKDSRVGAMGATAFVCLMLLDWGTVWSISPMYIALALYTMPLVGRLAMVLAVALFPYARKEGMGKAFKEQATRGTALGAAVLTVLFLAPFGRMPMLALFAALVVSLLLSRHYAGKLGGLTGDVYGAVTLLTETSVLLAFAILPQLLKI